MLHPLASSLSPFRWQHRWTHHTPTILITYFSPGRPSQCLAMFKASQARAICLRSPVGSLLSWYWYFGTFEVVGQAESTASLGFPICMDIRTALTQLHETLKTNQKATRASQATAKAPICFSIGLALRQETIRVQNRPNRINVQRHIASWINSKCVNEWELEERTDIRSRSRAMNDSLARRSRMNLYPEIELSVLKFTFLHLPRHPIFIITDFLWSSWLESIAATEC